MSWHYPAGADTAAAPWNQPDAPELEDCPLEFDGDCANPECDHCHCVEAPACGCDGAHGKCPGMTACEVVGHCECEPEPYEPCRCGDFCRC